MTRWAPRTALAALAGTVLISLATGCGAVPQPAVGSEQRGSTRPTAPARSTTTTSPSPSSSPKPAEPPAADPVKLSANVKNGATGVTVDTLVAVQAFSGKLTKVDLQASVPNAYGIVSKRALDGSLSSDKASWIAAERLEPSGRYTLKMVGENSDGESVRKTARFTAQALALQQQTYPTIYPLKNAKVGVGMPVVLHFDVPVKDKAEFQKNLHVTVTPKQEGTWRWFNSREVHFRPKTYWKAGTQVSVKADLNGVSAGNGVYGQRSVSTNFSVGREVVTKINLKKHQAKVYINGKFKRRIPISGGKAGWESRSGTKVVMDKLPTVKMTNEMIGADEDYDLDVKYALRVTSSGEFLHAAPWNAAYLGRVNASHGCIGMSTPNGAWLFNLTKIGDPVVTTGSSRELEDGNGYTDWDLSWAQYQKGSAA